MASRAERPGSPPNPTPDPPLSPEFRCPSGARKNTVAALAPAPGEELAELRQTNLQQARAETRAAGSSRWQEPRLKKHGLL